MNMHTVGLREALDLLNEVARSEHTDIDAQTTPWFNATNALLVEIANREGRSIRDVVDELKAGPSDRVVKRGEITREALLNDGADAGKIVFGRLLAEHPDAVRITFDLHVPVNDGDG